MGFLSQPLPSVIALNDIKFGLGDIKFAFEVMNDFLHMQGWAVVAKPEEMNVTADASKG